MKAKLVHENMEFNFKDPPYKRYESKRGVRGPQVPNPKKSGYGNEGLSDQEIETETRSTVRKAIDKARPNLEYIEDLANQSSPAGVLAKTILAIQNEETTIFLDELLEKWKISRENINTAGTYQPLREAGKLSDNSDLKAKQYILLECNRLLGELIEQQTQ